MVEVVAEDAVVAVTGVGVMIMAVGGVVVASAVEVVTGGEVGTGGEEEAAGAEGMTQDGEARKDSWKAANPASLVK